MEGLEEHSQYSKSLWAGRTGDRILVGAKFAAPVQTSPGAHPAFYTMGTGFFLGVPSSAKVKERAELYLFFPSGPSWPVLG